MHRHPQIWQRYAQWLLRLPEERAIYRILRCLSYAHQVDRVWIVRYNPEFTRFWVTHEWARGEIPTFLHLGVGAQMQWHAWAHETLLEDRPLHIPDAQNLPRRAQIFEEEMRRQKILSMLIVPGFHRGRLSTLVGYDAVQAPQLWSVAQAEELHAVARLICARFHGCPPAEPFPPPDRPAEQRVFVHEGSVTRTVELRELVHLDAWGSDTKLHLVDGQIVVDQHGLGHWEQLLAPQRFIRIHRSRVVNQDFLDRIERRSDGWFVYLRDRPEGLRVGRSWQVRLRHAIGR